MMPSGAVLLDTCAVIWLSNGTHIRAETADVIRQAGEAGLLFVSTASAWEIGMLSRPRRDRSPGPVFLPDPKRWFANFLSGPGVSEARITPDIAIDASYLPGSFPLDPMDRLIVATARHRGMPIVTSDLKILAYAGAGHVRVIPC